MPFHAYHTCRSQGVSSHYMVMRSAFCDVGSVREDSIDVSLYTFKTHCALEQIHSQTERSLGSTFPTLVTFFPNACACEENDRIPKKPTSAGPTHAQVPPRLQPHKVWSLDQYCPSIRLLVPLSRIAAGVRLTIA